MKHARERVYGPSSRSKHMKTSEDDKISRRKKAEKEGESYLY